MSGRWALAALAACLLAISGLVYGLQTDRWGMSEARNLLASKITSLPIRIGDWIGDDMPLDPRLMRYAEADAWLQRRYVRERSGEAKIEATLILMSGRPAAISVHTPDVCFGNSGFRMEGQPRVFRPQSERDDSLWQARFSKSADSAAFHVYWGWSNDGRWHAAEDARLEFSRSRALCKIYLLCPASHSEMPADSDAARQLMTDLLPVLHHCLTSP